MDPLDIQCSACLAPPGEQCYATSSDLPRPAPHRMRILAAELLLKRCPECDGIGWVPIAAETDEAE